MALRLQPLKHLALSLGVVALCGCDDPAPSPSVDAGAPRPPAMLPAGYTVEDHGTGTCLSMNEAGLILGFDDAAGGEEPFLLSPDGTRATLAPPQSGRAVRPLALSDKGLVVGEVISATGRQAVTISDGAVTSLGALVTGGWSSATAVNDKGDVAGMGASTPPPAEGKLGQAVVHGLVFSGGTVSDIGVRGGKQSAAYALNGRGDAVGILETADGSTHAFLYADKGLTDLGTLGGKDSAAYAVNDDRVVVGVSDTASGEAHAFRWENQTMTDLGPVIGGPGRARSINDSGIVVGVIKKNGGPRPFAYAGGAAVELLPAKGAGEGFLSAAAEHITSSGKIVGWGLTVEGATRCLVWTPGGAP